jgi:hypothetical protein
MPTITRYLTLCMRCIAQTGREMLTGYTLMATPCDRCHRISDCAMTQKPYHA